MDAEQMEWRRLTVRYPTPSLRNALAWRRDFLAYPEDFPATDGTRRLWRKQARFIEGELRKRGEDS